MATNLKNCLNFNCSHTQRSAFWQTRINHSFLVASLLLIIAFTSDAGEVLQNKFIYKKGHYEAWLEMQIQAPAANVYALLTDFNHLDRLSDSITESKLLSDHRPEFIVQIKTSGCILFFCKVLQQTQRVTEIGDGHIMVEDIKGKSDFVYADTLWHIRAHNNGTRIAYSAELKPDFWLPPLLGPWLFKKQMLKETRAMIERMEKLANKKVTDEK